MPTPDGLKRILEQNGFNPEKLTYTVSEVDKALEEAEKLDSQTRQETFCDLEDMKAEMEQGKKVELAPLYSDYKPVAQWREDGAYLYVDGTPIRIRSLINQLEKLECHIKEYYGQ